MCEMLLRVLWGGTRGTHWSPAAAIQAADKVKDEAIGALNAEKAGACRAGPSGQRALVTGVCLSHPQVTLEWQ